MTRVAPSGRGTARVMNLLLVLLLIIAVAGVFVRYFPTQGIRRKLKSELATWLQSAAGSGAQFGDIRVAWRSLTIHDIRIPLGQDGSTLLISRITVRLDPLGMARGGAHMQGAVTSIHVSRLEIEAVSAGKASVRDDSVKWIPRTAVSSEVYRQIERFSNLESCILDTILIRASGSGKSDQLLCELHGECFPAEQGGLRLAAQGSLLDNHERRIQVTGLIRPAGSRTEIQVLCDIPPELFMRKSGMLGHASSAGGSAEIRIVSHENDFEINGSAFLRDIRYDRGSASLGLDSLALRLSDDTLTIMPCQAEINGISVRAGGTLLLRGKGELDVSGTLSLSESADEAIKQFFSTGAPEGRFHIGGTLANPVAEADFSSDSASLGGIGFTNLDARFYASPERVVIENVSFENSFLSARFNGEIELDRQLSLLIAGEAEIKRPPVLLGAVSPLRRITITISGNSVSPIINAEFRSESQGSLGNAILTRNNRQWIADFADCSGGTGRSVLEFGTDEAAVEIDGAHTAYKALFGDSLGFAAYFEQFDIHFAGSVRSGDFSVHLQCDTVFSPWWLHTARSLVLNGYYERTYGDRLEFDGQWEGVSADSVPFTGRANLAIADDRLLIDRAFIDEVGELSGQIDLSNHSADLEMQIRDLSIARLPFQPNVLRRAAIEGIFSGYGRLSGPLDNPIWSGSMAMTDGSILGVPGYWMNLEADGVGGKAEIKRYEVGRDILKILEVSGDIDIARDSIDLNARVASGRAEDFFLALIGGKNIASGVLDGSGTITGRLSRPKITAIMSINSGELLGEIAIDELDLAFDTDDDGAERRVYRITNLSFSKTETYHFDGTARINALSGDLSANVTGAGDFLDILDQIERPFATEGSNGRFSMELGGTVQHPVLERASLSLENGRFVDSDATPNPVSAEIFVSVAQGGLVEPSTIMLRSGSNWLEVRAMPLDSSSRPNAKPLIIPVPRFNLGVIEVLTGEAGFPIRFGGLMKPEWYGYFVFGSSGGEPATISSYDERRLIVQGDIGLRNTRLTFPFLPARSPLKPVPLWLNRRLIEAEWDLSVSVAGGNHYDVEITGLKNSEMFAPLRNSPVFETLADYLDHLSIDALIDPVESPLQITGCIDDSTFRLSGKLTSTRGNVDYLDQTFNVSSAVAEFDETTLIPILEGRAETEGVDSLGRAVPVYLTMYQIDRETNIRQKRGRFDRVTYVLESDAADTPEDVLRLLGYDITSTGGKASQLVASTVVRMIGRQWLDPLERRLERWTPLDEVVLTPGSGRISSLSRQQRSRALQDTLQSNSAIRFFSGSQLTVGKYFTPDVFLTYTGELAEGQIELGTRIGLIHIWNLEYRISPLSRDLVLDLAVEYDEVERRRDESVSVKYSFALEP